MHRRSPFGSLVERGAVTRPALDRAILASDVEARPLAEVLARDCGLAPDTLLAALSRHFGCPPWRPERSRRAAQAIARDHEVALRPGWAPLALEGGRLELVMVDPVDIRLLDEVRLHLRPSSVAVRVGLPADVREARRALGLPEDPPPASLLGEEGAALVDAALAESASGLRLEPVGTEFRAEIDRAGKRHPLAGPWSHRTLVQIEVAAEIDISDRRRAQDGRYQPGDGLRFGCAITPGPDHWPTLEVSIERG